MSAQTETDKDLDDLDEIDFHVGYILEHSKDSDGIKEGFVWRVKQKVLEPLPALIAELRAARAIVQEIHRIDSIFTAEDAWYFSTLEDLLREYDALRGSQHNPGYYVDGPPVEWETTRGDGPTLASGGSLQLKPGAYEEARALEDKLRAEQDN